MKIKQGVTISGIQPEILMAACIIDTLYSQEYGRPEGVTITSITDGKHKTGSKHYIGQAIDCRTHYFDKQTKHELKRDIANALGAEFDVVLEKTHIHVEFDPK